MSLAVVIISVALIILCCIGIYHIYQKHWKDLEKTKKRYYKKARKRCCICGKRVPRNNKYSVSLTDHKYNLSQTEHGFHVNCVKSVLENPEWYAQVNSMIIKTAIVCYDQLKEMKSREDERKNRELREIKKSIEEAKTRNLDFFLEEAKGADFK